MPPITFYPGPSRIYPEVPAYIQEGYESGILSMNHRSSEFMQLVQQTKDRLKMNLGIPDTYEIIFVSSATECWEIIAQSLIRDKSQHFFNGAFGQKWAGYVEKLGKQVLRTEFLPEKSLPVDQVDTGSDWICITQNETSNATQVDDSTLVTLRRQMTDKQLLAVDATSSLGGIKLNFELGDYWYASVQKCLGLPSGMALLILSPAR